MKFSEMPYSRPDMEALAAATTQTLEAMKAAPNAAGQIAAYDAYEKKMQTAGTMQQIAYIRHTINTKRRRAFQPLQYKAFRRFFVQKG